jgi:hypothetical protein
MPPRLGISLAHLAVLPLAALSWAPSALAAVPAGYTGTPYQGTPQVIPGRVELADLDEGGLDVAFFADHRRENAVAEGYSPISGDDHRAGNLDLPNICKTNKAVETPGTGSEDFWEDGKRYPSDEKLYEYYMGYAHTVDWVRVTVNVQQAGKYTISSNWACANPNCGFSVWFNDGDSPADNPDRPLDGENKTGTVMLEGTNDYHKWRAYPNMAELELEAGVQLMTFHVEVADHLQYGFLQFDLVGGNPGGAGGSGGAATAGAAAGGGAGALSMGGAPGSSGTATQATAGTPAASGSTGAPVTTAGTAGVGSGGNATTGSSTSTESGCALSSRRPTPWASLLTFLALVTLWRSRRDSTAELAPRT